MCFLHHPVANTDNVLKNVYFEKYPTNWALIARIFIWPLELLNCTKEKLKIYRKENSVFSQVFS